MMKKKTKVFWLTAAALVFLTGAAVPPAMAYFTTYSTAGGGVKMNMGFTETVPNEQIKSDGKHVTISNTGKYDCFVRVKAFAPVSLGYKADKNWSKGKGADDYWYYSNILPAGQTTDPELVISYEFPSGNDKPEEFNVIVIQECTPVLYKEDGTPYADWNHVIKDDSTQTTE